MTGSRFVLVTFVTLFMAFLLLPLVVIVISSFNAGAVLAFPPSRFTTRWYSAISQDFWQSLWLSLRLAVLNMAVCMVIGVPTALALVRSNLPWKAALNTLCLSPLMVPSLVIAVSAYQFAIVVFDLTGFSYLGTEFGILVGHCAAGLPFVIRSVIAGQAHFDRSLEEAASGLGAGSLETFFRVTLPLLTPAIAAGAIFAFLASFEDLAIALFLGGTGTSTLPVQIYSTVEFNMGADIMAISTIIIASSFAVLVLIHRFVGLEKVLRG